MSVKIFHHGGGAIKLCCIQYVEPRGYYEGSVSEIGFTDGTEDLFDDIPVADILVAWRAACLSVYQADADSVAIDLAKIASIRNFPMGHEDSPYDLEPTVRVWFENGELFIPVPDGTDGTEIASQLIAAWTKWEEGASPEK